MAYSRGYVRSRLHLLDLVTLREATQKRAENLTKSENPFNYAAKVLFSCLTERAAGLPLDMGMDEIINL